MATADLSIAGLLNKVAKLADRNTTLFIENQRLRSSLTRAVMESKHDETCIFEASRVCNCWIGKGRITLNLPPEVKSFTTTPIIQGYEQTTQTWIETEVIPKLRIVK